MSGRRGTALRPLGLYLRRSGVSLPYLLWDRVATASQRRPARRQRAAQPENPGAPLGTLELVVRAAGWAHAPVYTRARPPGLSVSWVEPRPSPSHFSSGRQVLSLRVASAASSFLVGCASAFPARAEAPGPSTQPRAPLPLCSAGKQALRPLHTELGEPGAASAVPSVLQPGRPGLISPRVSRAPPPHPSPPS